MCAGRCCKPVTDDGGRRPSADSTPNVDAQRLAVPEDWPDGTFDLVVLSEIGYYLRPEAVIRLRDRAVQSLRQGGELLAVHWRGRSRDHLLHGDEVHDVIGAAPQLRRRLRRDEERFILKTFDHADG